VRVCVRVSMRVSDRERGGGVRVKRERDFIKIGSNEAKSFCQIERRPHASLDTCLGQFNKSNLFHVSVL
jgi:hypothetical protein